jgi:hypothetical protein
MNAHLLGPFLLSLCLASPSARASTVACGGDAFSSAEVVTRKDGPRRGPVTASPDTLCADLSGDRPATAPNIDVVVGGASGQPGTDAAGQGASASGRPSARRLGR